MDLAIGRRSYVWILFKNKFLLDLVRRGAVKSLDASGNHLPGGFQVNITRLTSMSELELSNLIRAKIFSAVGNYKTVEMLWLSCMRLEGTIPSDLCNHTKLVEIVSFFFIPHRVAPPFHRHESTFWVVGKHDLLSGRRFVIQNISDLIRLASESSQIWGKSIWNIAPHSIDDASTLRRIDFPSRDLLISGHTFPQLPPTLL